MSSDRIRQRPAQTVAEDVHIGEKGLQCVFAMQNNHNNSLTVSSIAENL